METGPQTDRNENGNFPIFGWIGRLLERTSQFVQLIAGILVILGALGILRYCSQQVPPAAPEVPVELPLTGIEATEPADGNGDASSPPYQEPSGNPDEFAKFLGQARKQFEVGLHNRDAAMLFAEAVRAMPTDVKNNVDSAALARAKEDVKDGEYEKAQREYIVVFENIH